MPRWRADTRSGWFRPLWSSRWGWGGRKTKNDVRDAQVLSEVSCRIDLPSVHVPSRVSRERKTLCGLREALVRSRVVLVLTVRGWLRTQHRGLSRGSVDTFAARVRKLYQEKSATSPSSLRWALVQAAWSVLRT